MAQGEKGIAGRLLRWYGAHARDLPWRRTRDPYRIWLSEIMLQQTRVAAVLEHYRAFLARFPSIEALARAPQAEVLALWSGLGYYRRARSLHDAARLLVAEHGGRLPCTSQALRELPGIGRYTAAAIASIAFGERTAVVDGNVERVLRRLFALDGPADLWKLANGFVPASRPGDFNQAMMEMGATVCLPQQPQCAACPLRSCCRTRGPGAPAQPQARRRAALACALARRGRSVYLVQRPAGAARMPGMWELPPARPNGRPPLLRLRHAITNTDYAVSVYAAPPPRRGPGRWLTPERAGGLPLTGLCRKILRRLSYI